MSMAAGGSCGSGDAIDEIDDNKIFGWVVLKSVVFDVATLLFSWALSLLF